MNDTMRIVGINPLSSMNDLTSDFSLSDRYFFIGIKIRNYILKNKLILVYNTKKCTEFSITFLRQNRYSKLFLQDLSNHH